jgi:hypothetical protein
MKFRAITKLGAGLALIVLCKAHNRLAFRHLFAS